MTDEDPIDGCAHCGVAERGHGTRHTVEAGWHAWVAPTDRLLRRRMWHRRYLRAINRNLNSYEMRENWPWE